MKNLCKRLVAAAMTLALALGLAVPAMAAGQTFSDVPSSYWGYADIEAVAEAGLMKGTGGDLFSPEMKVSVAQFLTLLGRLVFPNVKADGADWYGPYVSAAQEAGLLAGTQVDTNNVEAEISRYDMAVILRAAAKKLGVAEKSAQSSEVTDYGMVPTMYADAVLAVYGMGLIKGDQAGNFNGSNTMMRAEVATVIMRLARAKPGGTTTEPDPGQPSEPETIHTALNIECYTPRAYEQTSEGKHFLYGIPVELRYTEDGGKTSRLIAECTSYIRGTFDFVSLETDIDKTLVDNENGQFYLSAETIDDGQRLVSQDLRTDGRATIVPIEVTVDKNYDYARCKLELVPPTGFKRNVTLEGHVHKRYSELLIDENGLPYLDDAIPNISVDLVLYRDATSENLKETDAGIVVGSAISGVDGKFRIETTVDTLDFGKRFRLEGHGEYDGQQWESTLPWRAELLNKLTTIVPNGMRLPDNSVQMEPVQ